MKNIAGRILALVLILSSVNACRGDNQAAKQAEAVKVQKGQVLVTSSLDLDFSSYKVTFIELGADRCIPCKEMQPIMKAIAEEFAGTIQVVFYDVWKDPAPARKYGIQLIPTQVFINREGREIFRHVGLFPKEEILLMLKEKAIL